MSLVDIVEKVKSGVVHIIHTINEARVSSGTGFMVEGLLVTNYHVACIPPTDSVVVIRTINSSPDQLLDGIYMTNHDFLKRTKTASDERNYDYIVLDIPELSEPKIYNFDISNYSYLGKRIGDDIFFLGYLFEHLNLVCHSGIISSFYKSKNIDVIQVDASVNHSNSGGPLIDPETGKVIGIVTRNGTGLTQGFESFRSILKQNIEILSNSGVRMVIDSLDFAQGMIVSQNQMLGMTYELERSANFGIGYAFSVKELINDYFFEKF
ncbi:MAG: trypsin-like peptidase domain-containing protein [Okeania sp. SIO2F4]|uniref:S1 family peptidase n=1 Tax=Okeania sp. SIO2F4 TaxID=2607790 RepID=UPI00142946E1|nr:serine protease [Okeania sp. SIO2F4]NES03312.1 trypsin-like peptidase domain-containing protein [Okeania sp. SIO2F4]